MVELAEKEVAGSVLHVWLSNIMLLLIERKVY